MKKVLNGILVACVAVGFSMVVGCKCPASTTKPAAPVAPKTEVKAPAVPKAEVKAPAVPAPAVPAVPAVPAPVAPASK